MKLLYTKDMKKKILAVILAVLAFIFITIYTLNNQKVAVLGYHGVLPSSINISGDEMIVDTETFEKELKILKTLGYKTLTLEEFYCWKEGKCSKPHKAVLITFDDGYMNNYEYAFDLLQKYDMNAVVFIIGSKTKEDNPNYMDEETINKAKEKYPNIEFASHSYDLHYHSDKTYDMVSSDAKLMTDYEYYYAYPYGEYNDEYISALKDNGYKLAFGFGPGSKHRKADITDDDYAIARLNISKNMPIWKFIVRNILPI